MDQARLAELLLRAKNKKRRLQLTSDHGGLVDADLARRLKDVCVENWAAAPKVTRLASKVLDEIDEQFASRKISAYAHWAGGIAEMTYGRLEIAIRRLEGASTTFAAIRMEYESAQPQIAALVALAMLGYLDRIPAVGRRALKILEKHGDNLSAGKVEINLSNVASRQGQHRQAEKLGLSAYSRFKNIKAKAWQAMAENGLAITYTELNDFRRAEKFFKAALRSARSTGAHVTEAEVLASTGNLQLFRGRYAEALDLLERSRQAFTELRMPHKSAIADLEIAEIYSELNLTDEASGLLTAALERLAKLKMPLDEARALLGLGRLAVRLGNQATARNRFNKALRVYERERNPPGMAAVTLNLAHLELTLQHFPAASTLARQAEKMFRSMGNDRQRLMSSWISAAATRPGHRGKVLAKLHVTLNESLRLGQNPVALLLLNSIGGLEIELGNVSAARSAYKKAVRMIDRSRAPLSGEEFRIAFLDGRLEPFEKLAQISITEGKFAEAFQQIEKARSRSLLEMDQVELETGGIPHEAQRLRESLNWSYNRLRFASESEARTLQVGIGRLEKKFADILRRNESLSRRRGPGSRRAHREFDLADLQKDLGPNRTLVYYSDLGGIFSAFVVTASRITFFPELAAERSITAAIDELRFQFSSLRYGREGVAAFIGQLKLRADALLADLYGMLLAPLQDEIGGRNLLIVPAGPAHYVPFAALRDRSGYVIENRTVSTAPSASVWQAMVRQPTRGSRKALLVAYADEAAPMVESEVNAISKLLPSPVVLSGEAATFGNLERRAVDLDLLHIACHGKFRADNPLYSNLRIADGHITVRDISTKRLRGTGVVLSACETGFNKIYPGQEIVGLARGFISAGVRSLVLSLWTVNDDAASRLMVRFYSSLQRGHTFEASLRHAQMSFIEEGEHPYYWSPFFSIG